MSSNKILDYVFVGIPDLMKSPCGLAMRRIHAVINCGRSRPVVSLEKQPRNLLNLLNLENNSEFSVDMFSASEIKNIESMFNEATQTKKVMIISDDISFSRRIYCLISMKILNIRLNELRSILTTRKENSKTIRLNSALLGLYDNSNCYDLTNDDLIILSKIEEIIFGSVTIVDSNIVNTKVETKIETKVELLAEQTHTKHTNTTKHPQLIPELIPPITQPATTKHMNIHVQSGDFNEAMYRSLLGMFGKKINAEYLKSMVKSGMTMDEIAVSLTLA